MVGINPPRGILTFRDIFGDWLTPKGVSRSVPSVPSLWGHVPSGVPKTTQAIDIGSRDIVARCPCAVSLDIPGGVPSDVPRDILGQVDFGQ